MSSNTPPLSPILLMARRAAALRAEGRDVIDLTLGEPDFSPPGHVLAAAQSGLGEKLGYSPSNGIPELRRAIQTNLLLKHNLAYTNDQITVGCGAKQVIFNAFMASLRVGDEVIIPAPYWASYPDMVRMCGGTAVIVHTAPENGFRLTPEMLAGVLNERTRWVVLNAPGNPSGTLYSKDELQGLAEVLEGFPQTFVMSDDIYSHIRYTSGAYTTLAAAAPQLFERTLLVDGVSKAYAMTGWRVGWGCGPANLIGAITSVQSQNCTQTSTLSQLAAIAALSGPQGFLEERTAIYRQRRDAAMAVLRRCPALEIVEPDGAFYLFPKVKDLSNDSKLALLLLEAGVATVPGSAFGTPGHLRLSFATDEALLVEGCRRLVATLEANV
ncbi:pyridoxal phosphate-dependent aminotransferase [Vogesella indigofera]|uniref:pyridoxal phosphate-dependent aminotransferase n=1 Tax=Vogesella indigofera TaxID=45465 RepID=UPI00234E50C4|nr:pyridoxal phosphate-dependent aminotransferase [Vogesella indigofera]MDC7712411.1 pyridoxal phosphate-dependent aminotransferase [Vogesella indigofera]